MTTQPEALRLADLIDKVPYRGTHEAAAELRRLQGEVESMRAERLHTERELRSLQALNAELRCLHYERERLLIEREHARIMYEHSVKLLTSIHSLLYPPATKLPDGRTMVFRPKDPDPHTILQTLSDRIRALPDEITAFAKAESEKKNPGVL